MLPDIASLRATQNTAMPETLTRRRKTYTDNGAGGQTEGAATDVATTGRVAATNTQPQEREIAEALQGRMSYTITLPYGFDVTAKDVIVWGSRTFEVVGVIRGSFETARRVVCVEVVA